VQRPIRKEQLLVALKKSASEEEDVLMSEEDLEVLINLDDPGEDDEEDHFHHLQAERYDTPWPGQSVEGEKLRESPADPTEGGESGIQMDNQMGPTLKT